MTIFGYTLFALIVFLCSYVVVFGLCVFDLIKQKTAMTYMRIAQRVMLVASFGSLIVMLIVSILSLLKTI